MWWSTASRAATTCLPSTWRWIPFRSMANWEGGYGRLAIVPDMATLRRIPWLDRTALVLCDVANHDGSPVVASPRQVLIAQYERAHEMGYSPMLAFASSSSTSTTAMRTRTTRTTAASPDDPVHPRLPHPRHDHGQGIPRPIRRGMHGAGIPVEFSKGEAWYGQHEVNTRYADAVTSADRHTIYKNGVKEIAFLNGISATFMAKPSGRTSAAPATSTPAWSTSTAATACSSTGMRKRTPSGTTWAAWPPATASWR